MRSLAAFVTFVMLPTTDSPINDFAAESVVLRNTVAARAASWVRCRSDILFEMYMPVAMPAENPIIIFMTPCHPGEERKVQQCDPT